jgi:enterobactin synthetase component F
MSGISLGFSCLLRHLDPNIEVYGLQSRGLRGGASLPASIDEIATDYLAQIRGVQPEGPYRLIGRSLGGLICHSIAEQMLAQNLQVELLAMIDSSLFTPGEMARPLTEMDEVRAALSFLDIRIAQQNTPQSLKELGEFLLQPDNAHSIPQLRGIMTMAKEVLKSDPEFIEHLSAVLFNNLKLARKYEPRKVDLNLLYFHATSITGDVDGIIGRSPSMWCPFFGGNIEVHKLACHHEAVLDPLPAAQIGRILQQRLSITHNHPHNHPDDQRIVGISPAVRGEAGEITALYA